MDLSQISVHFPYGDSDGRIYDIYYVCGVDPVGRSV